MLIHKLQNTILNSKYFLLKDKERRVVLNIDQKQGTPSYS